MRIERTEVGRRELALLVAGACLLSVVMHWPLVLHLGTDVPKDLGDPLVQSWQVAWDGNALAHQPLDFFQANQFWPLRDTLAFSDALIGYAPAGLIGSGPEASVARYDVLFLLAYALAFVGAYLLARELGVGYVGAAVAGAAFAFAPFRLEQDGHMHIISSGGIPLALALGIRGYRLGRPWVVVAGFCVAAWQVSLGFSLGLPLAYLIAVLGLLAAVRWVRAGRPSVPRSLAIATLAGALVFAGTAVLLSRPYARVQEEHPNIRRSAETVENFSGPPEVFLVAPDENALWGGATAGLRDGLENVPEKTLFPGLVTVALALGGLVAAVLPRGLRIGLGLGVLVVSVLALGFQTEDGLLWPYRIAYEALPGVDGIRAPGRLVTFSSLGLALLAGAGAEAARRWLTARGSARAPGGGRRWGLAPAAPAAFAAVLVLGVVVEGRGLPFDPFDDQAQPAVPEAPASFAAIPAPQLHLPAERPEDNRRYLLWSTDGFPATVNGRSSLDPVFTAQLIAAVRGFPDAASVELLQRLGVRSVVLHPRRAAGTPWERAVQHPVAGLPLERERKGDVVVYEILSPSAGAGTAIAASAVSERRSR
ncbi:MAG TPA: hypothetical protein VEK39_14115 [Solirubrobacterales bacterium]|nr:hypothetical protein [Solirubrobacterales bacterium]